MKILAVILILGVMLSSCANSADSQRENDSVYTEVRQSVSADGVEMADSEELSESSQEDTDSSGTEDEMKWRLFDDTYSETDSGRAADNYAKNSRIKIEGMIKYGQENPPVCDMLLGKCRFAQVGCEVIAAYNYLTYEGFEPDMARLAYDFEKNALIAADGSLGSNPRRIGGLFKALGVEYEKIYDVPKARKALDEGRPVIISFHIGENIFSGIHTVFAVKEDGRIYVYNRYNSVLDRSEIGDISELMNKESLFIVGYTTAEKQGQ